MAVAQLYSFEDFPDVIRSFALPGGGSFAYVLASLVVTFEVLAVPFLLYMRISPLMRIVSMACGLLSALVWFVIALWINLTINNITNVGLLGATIPLPTGWWMLIVTMILLALIVTAIRTNRPVFYFAYCLR